MKIKFIIYSDIFNIKFKFYNERALSDEFVIVIEDKSEEYFCEIISGVGTRSAIPNEGSVSNSINKSSAVNDTIVSDCNERRSSSKIDP